MSRQDMNLAAIMDRASWLLDWLRLAMYRSWSWWPSCFDCWIMYKKPNWSPKIRSPRLSPAKDLTWVWSRKSRQVILQIWFAYWLDAFAFAQPLAAVDLDELGGTKFCWPPIAKISAIDISRSASFTAAWKISVWANVCKIWYDRFLL